MRESLLNESVDCTIAADGTGTVYLGPTIYGVSWNVSVITIQCTSSAVPQFMLYRNAIMPGATIGGSWSGNMDADTSDSIPPLLLGEKLIGHWSGADSGSTATMVINGTVRDQRGF